jgi:hypothetical protein
MVGVLWSVDLLQIAVHGHSSDYPAEIRVLRNLSEWNTDFTPHISTKSKLTAFVIEPRESEVTHELSGECWVNFGWIIFQNKYIWKHKDRRGKYDIKIDFYEVQNLIFVVFCFGLQQPAVRRFININYI